MFPLRIISYAERPKPIPTGVAPVERSRDATQSTPLPALEAGKRPPYERRMQGNRRTSERREKEQAAFLDTRTAQGRRRSPGRRAEDQYDPQARIAISIRA